MSFFDWKEDYATGFEEIDLQHQELVRRVNELHRAFETSSADAKVSAFFKDLLSYTESHFGDEEALMIEHAFPGFEQHRTVHDALRLRTQDLRRRLDSGEPVISTKLMEFLKSWLVEHITGMDRQTFRQISAKIRA